MTSRLDLALALLHTAPFGALATHSLAVPGYPFASALPYVTDEHHRPVFLISRLAEHTQNLLADARASLLLAAPENGSVQTGARATVVGEVARIEAPSPLLVERYLRYHPDTRDYLKLDFAFFRLQPLRIRVIGGFGQAGWLDGRQLLDAPSVPLQLEARVLGELGERLPAGSSVLGLDAYGVDCPGEGRRVRHAFAGGAVEGEALLPAVLRALA